MTIKHEGLKLYRLDSNPMERAYHDAWLEENSRETFYAAGMLSHILDADGNPVEASERDARVAATVIQWLCSPVGQDFVAGVQGKEAVRHV